MFCFRDGMIQICVGFSVSGIKPEIPNHFKVFFRDMLNKTLHEIKDRNGFLHILFIFMTIIMEGDEVTIIFIDTFGGDNRTSKISADIFNNGVRFAFSIFSKDIETVFMIRIAGSFYLFERISKMFLEFIKECSLERKTEECKRKMFYIAPFARVTNTAFRNQTVDVRIPF